MSIPLLNYQTVSQNVRVNGFEIAGDEHARIYNSENILSSTEWDVLISSAYRQICSEQQMLKHYRQQFLESQLRCGQITVREFIRGLVLSDSFRRLTYDSNNNYRFVEICIQRILGRNVYGEQEKIAWSIVLATKGLAGFVDDLLNTDEYLDNFGYGTVPYQRRRILPTRSQGEVTFAHMARYGTEYRDKLPKTGTLQGGTAGAAKLDYVRWSWQNTPPQAAVRVGQAILWAGAATIALLFGAVLLGL
jgi:phycobilisome rod-core linker protein